MMADESSVAVFQIAELLKNKDLQQVISFMEGPENSELVKNSAWDLIPLVCSSLKEIDDDGDDGLTDFFLYEKILLILASKGNPKEVLLGFLEEADHFKTDKHFSVLLKPLQKVLLLVPGRRGRSLEEVLSTLYAHILSLPPLQDYNLEGDETLLLDLDPIVQRTSYLLESYLQFFAPFVEEVSIDVVQKNKEVFYLDRTIRQREILGAYLVRLLHHPLLYYDLHHDMNKPKGSVRICCEKIILYLAKMFSNLLILYDLGSRSECPVTCADDCSDKYFLQSATEKVADAADDSVTRRAVATLAYLIFFESLAPDARPYVYSHNFIFQKHVPLVISLLSNSENLVLYKGLNLAKFFIDNLSYHDLSCEYLEMDDFVMFPKVLTNIAVHCPVEGHRHLSVTLLRSYLSKYDWRGRYRLILLMISSVKHAGVLGLMINMYKDFLHFCLNSNSFLEVFVGKNLRTFLVHAVKLPENVETDLLESSDQIMSALNLLRYLVLRDKRDVNVTGIWTFIDHIDENFLKPLQTALVLSRAHYKLEKQCLLEGKPSKNDSINPTVTVGNHVLPNVPLDHKMKIINTALLFFDMMESVLMRIKEVL